MRKKNIKNTSDKVWIKPLGDKVLIKPSSEEDIKSPSGIIIPDTVDKKQTDRGIVVAVGEGRYDNNGNLIPMNLKKDDKVLYQWGDKVEYDGNEYYVVSESNILAIIK